MSGESITIQKLRENFPDEIIEVNLRPGDDEVLCKKDRIVDICRFLRDDADLDYNYFIDICGVDYQDASEHGRFASVYHVFSLENNHRIRLVVPLREDDLAIDSVVEVWKGAEWFEREAFDLIGIHYNNHPFLRRILCHNQFVGHALRKDYDPGKRQLCTEVWDLDFD
jgi:NADH/F420H2 dehydrogenase subunit C